MDIHKPKPWHGAREFLKEYVIIFVGVLTALISEQAVGALNVRAEVREARAALHDEIASDAMIALVSIEEDRCLGLGLNRYEAWAHGGPRAEMFRGGFPFLRTSAWEEVRSGPVAHMPLKERLALADFYDFIANERDVIGYERNAFRPLIGMSQKTTLNPGEAQHLLELVAEARLFGGVRTANAYELVASAKALGAPAKPIAPFFRQMLAWQCGNGPLGVGVVSPRP